MVAMYNTLEGAHTVFLREVTRKRARQILDGIWETPRSKVVR